MERPKPLSESQAPSQRIHLFTPSGSNLLSTEDSPHSAGLAVLSDSLMPKSQHTLWPACFDTLSSRSSFDKIRWYRNCLKLQWEIVSVRASQSNTAIIDVTDGSLKKELLERSPAPQLPRLAWRDRLFWAVSFPVVLTLLVVGLVFTLSRKGISDPDIWWHLHNAQFLAEHHSFLRADSYSFTVPGHAWINHEWLGELPYYLGWRILGLSGIHAVMFVTLTLIFMGILYLSYRESGHYKSSSLATSFVVFFGCVSFGPRTILFGYLYLLLLLIVLQKFRKNGDAPLWTIPLLFCLWVNTHGSWSIGIIFLSFFIASGLIDCEWGSVYSNRWTRTQRKKLLITWIASAGALFLNPYGARLVFYPLDLAFRQRLNIEHVAEWVSINFHDVRGKLVIVLLVVLLLSTIIKPRRWNLGELGIVLFALYSGLTYIRFLFLVAIVIAPVLAKTFDFVPRYRRELDTPRLNACVILLIAAACIHFWPREEQLEQWVAEQYPEQALSYLRTNTPHGALLNFYLWGGYLNWRDPEMKVFVDSRVDIFEYSGVLKDYLDLLSLRNPAALLDKYQIRYVLFPPDEPFTYLLEHASGWKVAYRDQVCVLFERTETDATTALDGRNLNLHRRNLGVSPSFRGKSKWL